jgi:heat shock protein HtpX
MCPASTNDQHRTNAIAGLASTGPEIHWSGTVAYVVLGAADGSLVLFVFSALVLLCIWLFIGTARRRRHRRPTDQNQVVEFQGPSGQGPNARQGLQRRAFLFLFYGAWAAFLGAQGEPILGPLAAVVLLEFALLFYRTGRITGSVVNDDAVAARVGPLVAELCGRASCAAPRVMLRDDCIRVACVRRVKGRVTIVLARPFVDRVSDPELAALLAHEVVHIVRDDLDAARRRAIVGILGGIALVAGAGAAVTISLEAAIPILTAAFFAGLMITNVALSPLSRSKEARADLEGAQLSGDPRALAQALTIADTISQEMRFTLYGRAPWKWLLAPVSWRMPTHPPMPDRIARLEAMA